MQNESITRTWHSVISAVITKTIHGRPNNFSAKSHVQQTNVIHEQCDDMQIYCKWCFIGRKLSKLTIEDLQLVTKENTDSLHKNMKGLLKAISTSCKAMGHTDKAAKYARRCCFAMLDHYGMNSLFLTTTPDDECSFRVRLYAKPEDWVSTILIFFVNYLFHIPMKIILNWNTLHEELELCHIIINIYFSYPFK
jgi:hypothetical protein